MYRLGVNINFHFSGTKLRIIIFGSHHIHVLYFFKKPPNCFPEWLYHFTFPSNMIKWSKISGYFQTFGGSVSFFFSFFYCSYSSRCVMISHCGFDLHFPKANGMNHFSCACHLFILFCEILIHVFCLFSNLNVWFFSITFWEFFYIL